MNTLKKVSKIPSANKIVRVQHSKNILEAETGIKRLVGKNFIIF